MSVVGSKSQAASEQYRIRLELNECKRNTDRLQRELDDHKTRLTQVQQSLIEDGVELYNARNHNHDHNHDQHNHTQLDPEYLKRIAERREKVFPKNNGEDRGRGKRVLVV